MQIPGLLRILSGSRYILILCHHNADPDSLGAATALLRLLMFYMPETRIEVSAPCGLSKTSRRIMPHLPAFSTSVTLLDDVDVVILVDTNNLSQLDDFGLLLRDVGKPLVFIDHHAFHPETASIATLYIIDENASSASEIVFGLYEEAGIKPDIDSASALFLGIAYDTRFFAFSRSRTLRIVARLVEAGVVAEQMLPLLRIPMGSSERIARLKAAQRLQRRSFGEWLVAYSSVGSFQASAARSLVALGAHVAIVGGERRGKLRISFRSSRDFLDGSGVHLGRDVASALEGIVKGTGGGHSTSAGFNGEGNLEETMDHCLSLLHRSIEDHRIYER